MDVNKINKEWGTKMLTALNMQQAAVILMVGSTKDRKIKVVMTTDLQPAEIKKALQGIIDNLFTNPIIINEKRS